MDKDAHRIDFDWAFVSVELGGSCIRADWRSSSFFLSPLVLFHTSPLPLLLFFFSPLPSLLHSFHDTLLTTQFLPPPLLSHLLLTSRRLIYIVSSS